MYFLKVPVFMHLQVNGQESDAVRKLRAVLQIHEAPATHRCLRKRLRCPGKSTHVSEKASQISEDNRSVVESGSVRPPLEMLVPDRTEQSLQCPRNAAQPPPEGCSSVLKTPLRCPDKTAQMPKKAVQMFKESRLNFNKSRSMSEKSVSNVRKKQLRCPKSVFNAHENPLGCPEKGPECPEKAAQMSENAAQMSGRTGLII